MLEQFPGETTVQEFSAFQGIKVGTFSNGTGLEFGIWDLAS